MRTRRSKPLMISGVWTGGAVLDVHTLRSVHIGVNDAGHDVYETERSELGELLFRLKYRGDLTALEPLARAAVLFLTSRRRRYDMIVPVPPSGERKLQPVQLLDANRRIARCRGKALRNAGAVGGGVEGRSGPGDEAHAARRLARCRAGLRRRANRSLV